MRAILLAALLALGGCELAEPTLGGTIASVVEAEREEYHEPSPKSYDGPLVPEVAWQVEVHLDDGTAVTVMDNGPKRRAPGDRVRLLKGEDGALLL